MMLEELARRISWYYAEFGREPEDFILSQKEWEKFCFEINSTCEYINPKVRLEPCSGSVYFMGVKVHRAGAYNL